MTIKKYTTATANGKRPHNNDVGEKFAKTQFAKTLSLDLPLDLPKN